MRVLLIEDDSDLADCIAAQLTPLYALDQTEGGKDGLYLAQTNAYDLIILDIGLPDLDGIEICRRLREDSICTPLLMLTAQMGLDIKISAFDCGADDYLSKPFQLPELLARIRALIRRGPSSLPGNQLSMGNLLLNTNDRSVAFQEIPISLKRKEFDILEFLMRNQNVVVTRGTLLEHVWDSAMNDMTNSIDVHVGRLRKKLHHVMGFQIIHTVYGFGYRLSEPYQPTLSVESLSLSRSTT